MQGAGALLLACLGAGWACRTPEPAAATWPEEQAPTRAQESEPSNDRFETEDPCAPATEAARRHAEGLVARLENDAAVRRELGRMGKSAWEPVREAARGTGPRSDEARVLLARLVDACAVEAMARQPREDGQGYALEWELEATFEQLPYVRVYKARPRYPRALIVDLQRGTAITAVDVEKMNELCTKMGLSVSSVAEAEALVAAYVELRYQPYEARGLEVFASAESGGYEVRAVFQRTTPWSPPPEPGRPISAIVGSQTTRHELVLRVSPDARILAAAETTHDAVTHPRP